MAPEVYPLVDLSLTILPQAYLAEDKQSVIAREPTNQHIVSSLMIAKAPKNHHIVLKLLINTV